MGEVVHYQMLHQIFRKEPNVALARSFILSSTMLWLCEESLTSISTAPTLLEMFNITDIFRVPLEDNPLNLTIEFKRSRSRLNRCKWRLQGSSAAAIEKLREDLRRTCAENGVSI